MGVYDGYGLQLLDEAGVLLAERSVPAGRHSERLEGLTSGRWYRVKVITLSGGVLSPEATAEGQTRESCRPIRRPGRPKALQQPFVVQFSMF